MRAIQLISILAFLSSPAALAGDCPRPMSSGEIHAVLTRYLPQVREAIRTAGISEDAAVESATYRRVGETASRFDEIVLRLRRGGSEAGCVLVVESCSECYYEAPIATFRASRTCPAN